MYYYYEYNNDRLPGLKLIIRFLDNGRYGSRDACHGSIITYKYFGHQNFPMNIYKRITILYFPRRVSLCRQNNYYYRLYTK